MTAPAAAWVLTPGPGGLAAQRLGVGAEGCGVGQSDCSQLGRFGLQLVPACAGCSVSFSESSPFRVPLSFLLFPSWPHTKDEAKCSRIPLPDIQSVAHSFMNPSINESRLISSSFTGPQLYAEPCARHRICNINMRKTLCFPRGVSRLNLGAKSQNQLQQENN